MKRPLVWVGIAYVTGEALAAAGIPLWGILFAAAVIFLIILTGRRQREAQPQLLCLLPVFVLSGFVVFSRAEAVNLVESAELPQMVTLCGTVSSRMEKTASTALEMQQAEIRFTDTSQDFDRNSSFPEQKTFGVILYADPELTSEVRTGDRILVTGQLNLPDQATNPGQFDMRSYLNARGFQYVCYPKQIEILSSSGSYRTLLLALRQKLAVVFLRLFGETEGGVACAMILGETACLPEEVRRLYQEMGIVHILAISGLHISMAGNGLFRILVKCRISHKGAALLSAFAVISYGVLTGFSPSTARAVIMFSVSMLALYLGRSYDMMTAASLAALILFTRHPLMLTQAGMQFSFGAICALGMLLPAYLELWKSASSAARGMLGSLWLFGGLIPSVSPNHKSLLRRILMAGAPSMVVTLATLPVTAWHYYSIPLLSLPLNLVVIPAMSVLVPLCFLTGIAGLLFLPAGALLGGGAYTLIRLSLLLCRLAGRLPMTSICCGRPAAATIMLYYTLLLLPIMLHEILPILLHVPPQQRRMHPSQVSYPLYSLLAELFRILHHFPPLSKIICSFRTTSPHLCALCAVFACLLISFPWQRAPDRIAFLDVGQGDCIVLRCDGRTCLVDGGSSSEKEVGKYVIEPFLKYYGLNHVDYAFVSHADEDHISGLRQLITDNLVQYLVLTKASRDDPAAQELATLAAEHGTSLSYIESGDSWSFGSWNYTCLYPDADAQSEDRNALSMILRAEKGQFRLLLTGDISSEQEKKLNAGDIMDCTVLKCAHHGSRFSSCEEFLHRAGPQITIISCAEHNSYGHPAPETVERLMNAGSRILYTMNSGAIMLQTDGKKLRLRVFNDP